MTSRDWATVRVISGDVTAIRKALDEDVIFRQDGSAIIELDEINWLDTDAIIKADPDATWIAYVGPCAEEGNACYIYHEGTLVAGSHVDSEPVIPINSGHVSDAFAVAALAIEMAAVSAADREARRVVVNPNQNREFHYLVSVEVDDSGAVVPGTAYVDAESTQPDNVWNPKIEDWERAEDSGQDVNACDYLVAVLNKGQGRWNPPKELR
jgi:hypothetical protein